MTHREVRRVCVVGAGGREHALARALAATAEVVVAPGNPGMTARPEGTAHPVTTTASAPGDVDADLWVIGPEAPLVDGLADRLRADGRLVFGPGADGAALEGSKAWMKQLLVEAGVPTAAHGTFDRVAPAVAMLRSLRAPWVVKTDGLAAGKGVLVTESLDEAVADVEAKLSGRAFGAAGRRVVIEEGMVGPEVSIMAVCDGSRAVALAPARDYKRIGEGDTGANTGGMGAVSPVPGLGPGLVDEVLAGAVAPTLAALTARGIDYRGVLYAGLMLTAEGPRVLEYNVRFGDPETQAVLARWTGDLTALLAAAAAGCLDDAPPPSWSDDVAVCVVGAAHGYPADPRTGDPVTGWEHLPAGVLVDTAGVATDPAGGPGLVTAGGRVLGITATGPDTAAARHAAYAGLDALAWPGRVVRRDIGAPAPSLSTLSTNRGAPL